MKAKSLVSVIIPVKNSASYLPACLRSVGKQSYPFIETLLIDSGSIDETAMIAKRFGARVLQFSPRVSGGHFEATAKRNFGAAKATGEYVYYIDADMELTPEVVKEAVALCVSGYDAVIVSEDSFGIGIWARAKNLERRCYWGDDTVEAPRFVRKSVWKKLGGLDETVGGGGDDWDLYQKLLEGGYTVAWTHAIVRHNEGRLSLLHLYKKRFMYGRDSFRYIRKRPKAGLISYFPIRLAYIRNWRLFVGRPVDTVAFIVMRSVEYLAGGLGVLYSMINKT